MQDATRYGTRGAESAPRGWWSAPTPFNAGAATAGESVAAFVNEGRWVITCPTPGCGGAQLAALDDPRLMCVECGNGANRGRWLPVTFPAALSDIVAALDVRRRPVDQNWTPGKSVAALIEENDTLNDLKVER